MFLLESVEGGAQRGRYSMIGLDPDLIFRSSGDRAEINRRALIDPDAFVPCPGDPLDALRALLAESRIADAARPAADVGGNIRLSRLRHGEAHGAPRASQARSDRRARSPPDPPDRHGGVRRRARRDVGCDAGPPGVRGIGPRRLRERHGPARRRGRRARIAARSHRGHGCRSARPGGRGAVEHDRGRIQGDGRPGEGLYRRRRRIPDRAVATVHEPLRPASVRPLSGAEAGQSVPLSLLPRLRRLPDCLLQSRNPGARARRQGRYPPDRRHPSARKKPNGRRGAGGRAHWPIRRSAPNISCCSTSAATTSAASPKSAR